MKTLSSFYFSYKTLGSVRIYTRKVLEIMKHIKNCILQQNHNLDANLKHLSINYTFRKKAFVEKLKKKQKDTRI